MTFNVPLVRARLVASALTSLLLLGSGTAHAAWTLNSEQSELVFVSIKKSETAEVGTFNMLTGTLADDGKASLTIDLGSVNTDIEIRDIRMRDMLFEITKYPSAQLNTAVTIDAVQDLQPGETLIQELDFTLELHGQSKSFKAPVLITALENGNMHVMTREPVIINAVDFNLVEGINQLREIAGLSSISLAIPVTAQLVFTRQSD